MSGQSEWLGPVGLYRHDHPPVRDVLSEHAKELTAGQRMADRLVAALGSWPFVIAQSVLLLGWIIVNVSLAVITTKHPGSWRSWDPYPFILLNLVLSFQAAYTGPIVMMSQNRAAEKDRLLARNDYELNSKSEQEIQVVMDHLAHQDRLLLTAMARLEAMSLAQPAAQTAGMESLRGILGRMEQNDRRTLALLNQVRTAPYRANGAGPGKRIRIRSGVPHQRKG